MSCLSKIYGGPGELESRQTMAYLIAGKIVVNLRYVTYIKSAWSTPQ